ncbi:MAG: iron ABC transporter permease [Tissierellales bacterium]|jgi:iron complex transport system permease protein|nr:iron ABC transporter permease [Tissierellales bacterium]
MPRVVYYGKQKGRRSMEKQLKYMLSMILLTLILICLSIFAVYAGKADLNALDANIAKTIFYQIRFPRVLVAIVVGIGLAISGTLFQALLNNPLADSYTLGIASGGAFGAILAMFIGIKVGLYVPIQLSAIAFALLTLLLVLKLAQIKGSMTQSSLVLAGIIVGSVFSAGLSLLKSLADEDVVSMVYWLMGNLASKKLIQILPLAIVVVVSLGLALYYSEELNLITLGKKEARTMGVDYDRVYKILIVTASVVTGYCVAICGIIAFVGLVVPHLARMLIGADNRKIIPLASILGGLFLLLADTMTRTILPHEIPVGVLTTLVGGPFFIYIYLRKRGERCD